MIHGGLMGLGDRLTAAGRGQAGPGPMIRPPRPPEPGRFGSALHGFADGLGASGPRHFGGQAVTAFGGGAGSGAAAGTVAAMVAEQLKRAMMEGLRYTATLGRIEEQPFVSERVRAEQRLRAAPVFGDLIGLGIDARRYASGTSAMMRPLHEHRPKGEFDADTLQQRMMLESRWVANQAEAEGNQKLFGLQLQRPQGFDRNDVAGRRSFEEEQQMLPIEHARQKSLVEQKAAEAKSSRFQQEEATLAERGRHLREEILKEQENRVRVERAAAAQQRSGAGGFLGMLPFGRAIAQQTGAFAPDADPAVLGSRLREQKIHRELDAVNKATEAVGAARTQAEMEAAQAKAKAGHFNETARKQMEYQQAAFRENRAEGQAERLGRMGMAGRMQGQMSLQLVQGIGVEAAPPELLAAAEAYAPETVRGLYHEKGDQFIGQARAAAPQEYRLGLTEARQDAAGKRIEGQKAEEADFPRLAEEIRKVDREGIERFAKFLKGQRKDMWDERLNLLQDQADARHANGGF